MLLRVRIIHLTYKVWQKNSVYASGNKGLILSYNLNTYPCTRFLFSVRDDLHEEK